MVDLESPEVTIAILLVLLTSIIIFFSFLRNSASNGTITVTELNIYPIKSCAEMRVEKATTTPTGFQNDRIVQITDANGKVCTPRDKDKAKIFHIQAEISGTVLKLRAPNMKDPFLLDIAKTPTNTVTVEAMDTPNVKLQDYGGSASAWLEKVLDIKGCRLTGIGGQYKRNVQVNPAQGDPVPSSSTTKTNDDTPLSLADEAPYLLTSIESLADLNRRLKAKDKSPVDMRRFRPNIVISGLRPWEEDTIKKIKIGSTAEFWVWQRCGRCTMTTIDRDELTRGPEPLATLSTFRERSNGMRNFGMHLIPVDGGDKSEIQLGDTVEILEYDEERKAEWTKLFS